MSIGNPVVTLRMPIEMLEILDGEIQLVNKSKGDALYDRSLFILTAIAEKLHHLERGRKRHKKTDKSKRDAPSLLGLASAEPARSLLMMCRARAKFNRELLVKSGGS